MRVSVNWLSELAPAVREIDGLAGTLTDIGIEVEAEEGPWPELRGTVVGRVTKAGRVPGMRLKACTVDAGSHGEFTVACGAPNARRGLRAPLAMPGAELPGGTVGERSFGDFVSKGMLCSAAELGLGDEAGTVMDLGRQADPGKPVSELLECGDRVLDLGVTPNRGDWLSMLGIARELCAKRGAPLPKAKVARLPAGRSADDLHEVRIEAPEDCPKFTCMPVSGVRADRPTPALIAERLRRCGVRPVSIIVDITNYVMLELGQPLHAFDRDKISGTVVIRRGKEGEALELIDGSEAGLGPEFLLVADESGPLAIGGVMGGMQSGITEGTTNVLLEAAHFVPRIVRGRTRELNISSEAAFRFERGVDPSVCEAAITKAARLVMRHCGGTCGTLNAAGATPPAASPVSLKRGAVEKLTGVAVDQRTCGKRLRSLGFAVRRAAGGALEAAAPSWRFDVERPEDLIEEVVRLGGFSAVPVTMPDMEGGFVPAPERLLDEDSCRDRLVAQGYSELVNYAFVDPAWERDFCGNDDPFELTNPLSREQSVMRSGLVGGLVDRAVYNRHRRQDSLRLFEVGRCFRKGGEGGSEQPQMVAGLCWGPVGADRWDGERRDHDYFDARAAVEALLPGAEVSFEPEGSHPALHPGRAARVSVGGADVGFAGELHPALLGKHRYDLSPAPAVFELDLGALRSMPHGRRARPVSKYPQVRRDLALTVSAGVAAGQLLQSAKSLAMEEVTDIAVFDSFSGGPLGEGLRSVGLRVTMQGIGANLVEERISEVMDALAAGLETSHGAKVRS